MGYGLLEIHVKKCFTEFHTRPEITLRIAIRQSVPADDSPHLSPVLNSRATVRCACSCRVICGACSSGRIRGSSTCCHLCSTSSCDRVCGARTCRHLCSACSSDRILGSSTCCYLCGTSASDRACGARTRGRVHRTGTSSDLCCAQSAVTSSLQPWQPSPLA